MANDSESERCGGKKGENNDINFKKLLFWLILFYCIDVKLD